MALEHQIVKHIEQNKADLIDLCCSLVNIPTPNPPGDGYERFVDFLSEWFSREKIPSEITYVPEKELSSLLSKDCFGPRLFFQASLQGREPGPTIYLQGHYDTIPATQDWTRLPFVAKVDGQKLWGLGTSDMKGGLASMMMATKALAHSGAISKGKLVFLVTPDEEFASGANIRYLFSKGKIAGDYAIVGEFSGVSNLFIGMKGGVWGDLKVKGRAAHGSQPYRGINAFEKLARVMVEVEDKFKPKLLMRKSSYRFAPPEYDTPTVMMGGILKGSNTARSAVPDRVSTSFDLRTIPEDQDHKLVTEFRDFLMTLKERISDLDLEMEVASQFPTYAVPEDSPLIYAFKKVITPLIRKPPSLSISCAATEAAFFVKHGIPAVVYGPGIWQTAHAKDEYVLVEDLEMASLVYALVASLLASGGNE